MVVFLAFLAAVGFAGSNVFTRRAVLWADPPQGVRLSVLIGPPFFALLAFLFGEMDKLPDLPWQAYLFFASAGIVHFILGRSLNYFALRIMGASRSTVITNISPLVAVTVAIPAFGETLSWPIALGILLVIMGPVVMAQGERRQPSIGPGAAAVEVTAPSGGLLGGVFLALGAGIMWGLSPILVKAGLNEADVPVLGTFISYCTAALLLGSFLVRGETRREFTGMDRQGLHWYFLSAVSVSLAQFLRYLAFSKGDVTLVVPLMQTIPIFVFALTFLINRRIESLNRYIIGGGVLVTLGAIVVVVWGTD